MLSPYLILIVALYYFYIFGLGMCLFFARKNAVKSGELDGTYFKTYQGEIPRKLKQLENNFNNQFQVPAMFMIVCLAAIQFKCVSPLFFVMSCLFVMTRFFHSYIHITSNKILMRAGSYFMGVIIVALLWLLILLRVLAGVIV